MAGQSFPRLNQAVYRVAKIVRHSRSACTTCKQGVAPQVFRTWDPASRSINTDILEHCQRNGLHTHGCWVVDLILGKEWTCAIPLRYCQRGGRAFCYSRAMCEVTSVPTERMWPRITVRTRTGTSTTTGPRSQTPTRIPARWARGSHPPHHEPPCRLIPTRASP